MDQLLKEFGQAMLQLLVHPLFYAFFLGSFFLGYIRVKKERNMFSTRIHDVIFELRHSIWPGIAMGLILSIVILLIGITIPMEVLYVMSIVAILFVLTLQTRFMSVVYIIGLSLILPVFISLLPWQNQFVNEILEGMQQGNIASLTTLTALLLLGEGLLIWHNGSKKTTPQLLSGKRGKKIGEHVANRFWLLPLFLWVPIGDVEAFFQWWPTFSVGNETYSLFLFPFILGFYQRVSGSLPQESIIMVGKRITVLALLVLLIGVGSIWIEQLGILAFVLGVIGRYGISYGERIHDQNQPAYFTSRNHGLVILDIIPTTPADKMLLKVGEIITKVNGEQVKNIDDFYIALQKNGAHCKLEVIDANGEIRFAQRALYRGEHHELGILFAEEHIPLSYENLGQNLSQ